MAITILQLPRIANLSHDPPLTRDQVKPINGAKPKPTFRHDLTTMKIPDLIRHFEARKRKTNLPKPDFVQNRTIYTDQVLRRRKMDKYFDISKSYVRQSGKASGRIKLPKLTEYSSGTEHVPKIDAETDDEYDRKWTKMALKGLGTDDELVRAYANQTPMQSIRKSTNDVAIEPGVSYRETKSLAQNIKPKTIQNKPLPTNPPETKMYFRKRRVPQPLETNSLNNENGSSNVSNRRPALHGRGKMEHNANTTGGYHVTAKKFSPLGHVSVTTLAMAGNSSRDAPQKSLNGDSEISTEAGKRLLRSLFGRINQEKQLLNARESNFKSNEKMSRTVHNIHRNIKSNDHKDDKYGVVNFNQLPSELIGLHFHQTCENLWKYLNSTTDGKIKKELKKYFPTAKQRLKDRGKEHIYIPTGLPTDALFIEGLSSGDENSGSEMGTESSPVTLRLNHRKLGENSRCETNSFNLEAEMDRTEQLTEARSLQPTGIFYDQLTNKLTISIPAHNDPEAPPTTPVSRYSDCDFAEFNRDFSRKNDDGVIEGNKRSVGSSPINFTANQLSRSFGVAQNESNMLDKEYYSTVEFPLPPIMAKYKEKLKNTPKEAKHGFQKVSAAGDTRVYKHGGYHVQIEQTVYKKHNGEDSNTASKKPTVFMTTPPFTFSYMASKKSNKLKTVAIDDLKQNIITTDSSLQPPTDGNFDDQAKPEKSKKKRARKKLRANVNKTLQAV